MDAKLIFSKFILAWSLEMIVAFGGDKLLILNSTVLQVHAQVSIALRYRLQSARLHKCEDILRISGKDGESRSSLAVVRRMYV